MNITDIVGFFQVVVPYLEVILVVAFFVISLANRLIRRFLSTTILPLDAQNLLRRIIVIWFMVRCSDACHRSAEIRRNSLSSHRRLGFGWGCCCLSR